MLPMLLLHPASLFSKMMGSFRNPVASTRNVTATPDRPAHPFRHNWYLMPQAGTGAVGEIERRMSNCSRVMSFSPGPHGYGSVLHQWAAQLCYALQQNASLQTGGFHVRVSPDSFDTWNGFGTPICSDPTAPPLACFYTERSSPCSPRIGHAQAGTVVPSLKPSAPTSRGEITLKSGDGTLRQYKDWAGCADWSHRDGLPFFALAFRWLFSSLSPRLVNYARQKATDVFGPTGVPAHLVTVHVRWGDKARDGITLQPISRYVDAVAELTSTHLPNVPPQDISVYITTEDMAAVRAFRHEVRNRGWKVYVYEPAVIQDSKVAPGPNGSREIHALSPKATVDAAKEPGWGGVHSLVTLMMALEAKLFVVTGVGMSSSNWGRLIDELRMAFVEDSFVIRI